MLRESRWRLTRWFLVLLVGVLAAFASRPALAQDDEDGSSPYNWMAEMNNPYPLTVNRSVVRSLARWAKFTPDQREAALTLHAAYEERFQAASTKMNEYVEALTNGDNDAQWRDEAIRKKIEPVQSDFREFTGRLDRELYADLDALLTPEQQPFAGWVERWSRFARESYRLGQSGGRTSLAGTVEAVLAPEEAPDAVAEALARYVKDVSALLESSEAAGQKAAEDFTRHQDSDALNAASRKTIAEVRSKGTELLDAARERIGRALTPEQRDEFEFRLLLEQGLGGTDISLGRVIRKASKLDSLTPEQSEQIAALRTSHIKAFRQLVEPIAAAQRRAIDRLNEGVDPEAIQADQAEMMQSWQKIATETEQASNRLREILTAEQREAVGPPIAKSGLVIPDFESDDEPPAVKLEPGMERMAQMMSRFQAGPDVGDTEVRMLLRSAKLTPDQAEAAKELVAAYHARFRLASRKFTNFQLAVTQQNMRGGMPDRNEWKRIMRVEGDFNRHKDRLRDELLADLGVLLTDEQRGAVELLGSAANRKRATASQWAVMSPGFGADLPALLSAATGGADPDEHVAELLARYEREMAPHAAALIKAEAESRDRMMQSIDAGDGDGAMKSAMESAEESMRLMDTPLREAQKINARYAEEVARALPEGPRERFEDGFYRAAGLGRMLEGTMGMTSDGKSPEGLEGEIRRLNNLTDEQKSRVASTLGDHARKARDLSREIYETILSKFDAAKTITERQAAIGAIPWQKQQARVQLDQQAMTDLMAILTPEQQGRLPNPYRPPGHVTRPVFDE